MEMPFNNPRVIVQSWYVAALSREVARGKIVSVEFADRSLALYRGTDGRAHVLDARCPHLGADLSNGEVVGSHLRCAFHHWAFAGDGRCVAAPALDSVPRFARTFSYPCEEKYGALWFFNGPAPLFPIPAFTACSVDRLLAVAMPPQLINCHPHVIASNGLDIQHFRTVHRLDFAREPRVEEPDRFRVRLRLEIRPRGKALFNRALSWLGGETLSATFTTWGGNLATIEGMAGPIPLLVLFSHRPIAQGQSASRTFLFVPRRGGWQTAAGVERVLLMALKVIMGQILVKDRELLDTLKFRSNLSEADAPLAAFIRQVNRMPVFDSARRDRFQAAANLTEAV